MRKIKRGLAVILALVMVMTIMPMQNVQAATTRISKCTVSLSKLSYNYTGLRANHQ